MDVPYLDNFYNHNILQLNSALKYKNISAQHLKASQKCVCVYVLFGQSDTQQ